MGGYPRRFSRSMGPDLATTTPSLPRAIADTRWRRAAGLAAAAGLLAAGLAGVTGRSGLRWPALIGGLALALLCRALAWRAARRSELVGCAAAAAAPILGVRAQAWQPPVGLLRASRWAGFPIGRPRRVVVVCPPGFVPAGEPLDELLAALSAQLGVRLRQHRFRRGLLTLTRAPEPAGPDEPDHPMVARGQHTIRDLLGAGADVRCEMRDDELVRIDVAYPPSAKITLEGYRVRVERVVSAMLPGRWRARWDVEGDRVSFELRPSFPTSIPHPVVPVDEGVDVLAAYDQVSIPYAVDEDGATMCWRPAIDPNLMVVGSPGTGKTVTMHGLLVEVSRRGWPVWVLDGKAIEFLGFRDWPNVQVVGTSIEEQIALVHAAHDRMETRYAAIVAGEASEADFEPLLVVVDEYRDWVSNVLAWYAEHKIKGDPAKPFVMEKVSSIARKGRSARVHLLFGTQRPDADFMTGEMRDNFRARLSMGRLSPQGALMMWQSPTVGVSIPSGTRGRGTATSPSNRPVEVQSYWTPDPRKLRGEPGDDHRLIAELRPATARHPRIAFVPDVEHDDSGEALPVTYMALAHATVVDLADRPDLDPVRRGAVARQVPHAPIPAGDAENGERTRGRQHRPSAPPATAGRPVLELVRSSSDACADAEAPAWPEDTSDGYGMPEDALAGDLAAGDQVLLVVDEEPTWVIVEDAFPDVDAADCVAIDYRTDDDSGGTHTVSEDELVTRRAPIEPDQMSTGSHRYRPVNG